MDGISTGKTLNSKPLSRNQKQQNCRRTANQPLKLPCPITVAKLRAQIRSTQPPAAMQDTETSPCAAASDVWALMAPLSFSTFGKPLLVSSPTGARARFSCRPSICTLNQASKPAKPKAEPRQPSNKPFVLLSEVFWFLVNFWSNALILCHS